jgi:hypothetical protein
MNAEVLVHSISPRFNTKHKYFCLSKPLKKVFALLCMTNVLFINMTQHNLLNTHVRLGAIDRKIIFARKIYKLIDMLLGDNIGLTYNI